MSTSSNSKHETQELDDLEKDEFANDVIAALEPLRNKYKDVRPVPGGIITLIAILGMLHMPAEMRSLIIKELDAKAGDIACRTLGLIQAMKRTSS